MKLLLEGGRLLCPASGLDRVGDLLIDGGRIAAIDPGAVEARRVDCRGKVVAPALVDLEAELCDPGRTWLEDLRSGSAAAAAGGFTAVLMSPRTDPVMQDPALVRELAARAAAESPLDLRVAGALTVDLAGEQLAELGLMADAGAAAFSDGGRVLADSLVLRHAMLYAGRFGLPLLLRPGEPALERGAMHEGEVSSRIGLRGIPASAEVIGVARLAALALETDAPVHIAGVSTARGLAQLRHARAEGAPITASVPVHCALLSDRAVAESGYDTDTRLSPPLRSEADRQAVLEALRDGTLDAVHSGHAPRSRVDKELEFALAAPGAVALETALSALVEATGDLAASIGLLSAAPARVLGLERRIALGSPAELVILDASARSTVAPERFLSKCRNTPLKGRELPVAVAGTLARGRLVHTAPGLL